MIRSAMMDLRPVVRDVAIHTLTGARLGTVPGVVDTGATVCCLPAALLKMFKIPAIDKTMCYPYDQPKNGVERAVYQVELRVPGCHATKVRAVAVPRDDILLGCNFLKGNVFVYDGNRSSFGLYPSTWHGHLLRHLAGQC